MRKIRSLKPAWIEDEKLCQCTPAARVLSAALMVLADDYGRGRANLVYLKSQVFPHTKGLNMKKVLQELIDIGYVVVYTCRAQGYYEVCNWSKHQHIKIPSKSSIPENFYGSSTPLDMDMEMEGRESAGAPPPARVPLAQEAANELPPVMVCSNLPQPLQNGIATNAEVSERDQVTALGAIYIDEMRKKGRIVMQLTPEMRGSLKAILTFAGEQAPGLLKNFFGSKNSFYEKKGWPIWLLVEDKEGLLPVKATPPIAVVDKEKSRAVENEAQQTFEAAIALEAAFPDIDARCAMLEQYGCDRRHTRSYEGLNSPANIAMLKWFSGQDKSPTASIDIAEAKQSVRALVAGEINW